MNLQALKTEITTDPLARYAKLSDEQIAELINQPGRQVDRDTVTGGEIMACIVRSEYAGLTAGDKAYVQLLVTAGTMPITANLKTEFGAVFPSLSTTRANLATLLKRTGSRGEELGIGYVTASHVADAKRS
jgi:hypothetical protein